MKYSKFTVQFKALVNPNNIWPPIPKDSKWSGLAPLLRMLSPAYLTNAQTI